MKKKQVIAIAAALAAVLLMSTAVYAIGNMGAENNQAGNPAEQAPLNTAGTEEMEALQTLTAEQVDISEFSVPLGTQAEQKKFIGNAVEVTMARVICEALGRMILDFENAA